jgi:hypothetical protein
MVSDLPIGKFDSRVYAHQLKGFESKATDSTNLTSEILDNRLSEEICHSATKNNHTSKWIGVTAEYKQDPSARVVEWGAAAELLLASPKTAA